MEEKKQPKPVEQAMDAFLEMYEPAETRGESDEQITTAEIVDSLSELIDTADDMNNSVYDILIMKGFTYKYFMGKFVWLLKSK